MNEVIRLSIIEILYLSLIVSVSVLTVYLAVALARLNDVLRDLKRVSQMAANVADGVDTVKNKAVSTFVEAADAIVNKLRGDDSDLNEEEPENENDDF